MESSATTMTRSCWTRVDRVGEEIVPRGDDGFGAWRENAGGAGAGLQGATLVGLGGDHAVEIDEQDQAAVGRDGCSGEKLHATQIFAEIFDDDFVFANYFLDDQADLAITGVGDDHAEVAVDRFERRKAEIGVEANDFGDDVADFSQQLSANVFDFVGAKAANLFDDREREKAKLTPPQRTKSAGEMISVQRNF